MLLPVECPAGTAQSSQIDWPAAAREDVLAAYDIFSRQHPGMFDPHNPNFPEQLRRAKESALAFGENINDAEGHMLTLAQFSDGLADGHARVVIGYNGNRELLWPGFNAVWRGDALYVADASGEGPLRGSALLACDGKDARRAIRETVSFFGRANEEGQWWTIASTFFLNFQSPYRTAPVECTFRNPDGRTNTYKLNWRAVPETFFKKWMDNSLPEPVGMSEPRTGILRLNLPTFSPGDDDRARYRQLFSELEKDVPRITAARAIVIDLRGNKGGSSSWSQEVAKRLWGEAAVNAAMAAYFRDTQIWWLADPANIKHFQDAAVRMRGEGRIEDAGRIENIATELDRSLAAGKRFYVENFGESLYYARNDGRPTLAGTVPHPPRQLPPVYIIVDGGCVSACLDGLDVFTRFPGVKLVGAPTSADTEYMDTRMEDLPSGRGVVILPTKIWVRRPRGRGEVYRPDIVVRDLDWTTAIMLDHVERDLVRQ